MVEVAWLVVMLCAAAAAGWIAVLMVRTADRAMSILLGGSRLEPSARGANRRLGAGDFDELAEEVRRLLPP